MKLYETAHWTIPSCWYLLISFRGVATHCQHATFNEVLHYYTTHNQKQGKKNLHGHCFKSPLLQLGLFGLSDLWHDSFSNRYCCMPPAAMLTVWGHSPTQKALKRFFIIMLFKSFSESPLGGYQLGHGRTARLQNGVWFLRVFWLCESSETTQVQRPAYVPILVAFQ